MSRMIEELYELCEMLEKDLKKTNEKLRKSNGELSGPDMDYVDKLTHAIKSTKSSIKMIDNAEGYSQAGDWEAMGRGHFGDYDRGNSYARRGEHYVRGHYSRSDGRDGNRGGYSRRDRMGRYSRDGGEDLLEHVERMMDEAETQQERDAIRHFKEELERICR